MYTLGFVLLGVGIVVVFAAFIFAVINMLSTSNGSIDNFFSGHLGAMIAMAIGGLVSVAGIIILGATYLRRLVN